jgi:hypothetical protein
MKFSSWVTPVVTPAPGYHVASVKPEADLAGALLAIGPVIPKKGVIRFGSEEDMGLSRPGSGSMPRFDDTLKPSGKIQKKRFGRFDICQTDLVNGNHALWLACVNAS